MVISRWKLAALVIAAQILVIAWITTSPAGVDLDDEVLVAGTSVTTESAAVVTTEAELPAEDNDELAAEEPLVTVAGTVTSAKDNVPLSNAVISAGDQTRVTGSDGQFSIEVAPGAAIEVSKPVWISQTLVAPDDDQSLDVSLEPRVVRALRAPADVAQDPEAFAALLKLAADSTVNSLVFDTKDESDKVLYESEVAQAIEMDVVDPSYDPQASIAAAHEAGLYAITRIVTFEDRRWVRAKPEAKLAGDWANAADEDNWQYPIALAVEACALGFDEIQFDYVRFPSGKTGYQVRDMVPQTSDARVAVIAGFLSEAKAQLHPMGCGVSAAIFGIVSSSPDDEQLGQTPEGISAVADAISPMIYPSHYNDGWLGFDNPNRHQGEVIAHALDSAIPRMAPGSLMRPWIQGFFSSNEQVLEQIAEAEARDSGWIIWNVFGNYDPEALPPN